MKIQIILLLALLSPSDLIQPLARAANQTASKTSARTWIDSWYTITRKKKPWGYYHQKVSLKKNCTHLRKKIKGGCVHNQNQVTRLEDGGFLTEEHLGTFSKNTKNLEPLFWNYQSSFRSQETKINGTINKKRLTVKTYKGKTNLKPIRRILHKKTIFAGIFPLWLSRKLKKMKPGKKYHYRALLEDNIEMKFKPLKGFAMIAPPDDFAKKTQSTRVAVKFSDSIKLTWWINQKGVPIRIEQPERGVVIRRVTKKAAEEFLDD